MQNTRSSHKHHNTRRTGATRKTHRTPLLQLILLFPLVLPWIPILLKILLVLLILLLLLKLPNATANTGAPTVPLRECNLQRAHGCSDHLLIKENTLKTIVTMIMIGALNKYKNSANENSAAIKTTSTEMNPELQAASRTGQDHAHTGLHAGVGPGRERDELATQCRMQNSQTEFPQQRH